MTREQAIDAAERAIAVVPEGYLWPETRWRAWQFVMMAEAATDLPVVDPMRGSLNAEEWSLSAIKGVLRAGAAAEGLGEGRERRVMKVGIARGERWIVDWPEDQSWPTVFLPRPTAEKQSSAIRVDQPQAPLKGGAPPEAPQRAKPQPPHNQGTEREATGEVDMGAAREGDKGHHPCVFNCAL